jgi:polygalacturonase
MKRIKFAAGSAVLLAAAGLAFGQSAQNPTPPLPTINTANIFNVTSATYGASTGSANNATAIQKAITAAAAASGGGTVEIPGPGTYLCGPLTLKSKVNLQVDAGATLMMLNYTNWPSTTTFISGSSISDVEISGSGTIDGNGVDWWTAFAVNSGLSRPNFIQFSSCNRILFRDITLQNAPTFHVMIKNNNANITVTNLTINTPSTNTLYPPKNTDGFDIGSTNILFVNSYISDGDDNLEIGGSALAAEITVTNCTFGKGHGISMGSITTGGVSNIMVINCTFSGTDNAIRMKSDVGNGGIVQNLSYYNIGMTNIKYAPILIYSYYTDYGDPTTAGITPAIAAGMTVSSVGKTTPVWRNIVISNVTATGGQPGMIWGLKEMPVTNLTLAKINTSGAGNFELYNVKGLKIIDSQVHLTSGSTMYELYNVQGTFTNSTTGAAAYTIDGITATNSLAFYNQTVTLNNTNFFGANPITVGGSVLTDIGSLTLPGTTPVNFALGTTPTTIGTRGSLNTSSTLNITDGGGFGPGTYTLFTYNGTLTGTPVLGTKPAGYNYSLDTTSTAGQVNLVVTSTNPVSGTAPAITNAPAPQTVYQGDSASFTVGASGTAPLKYQWLFNATNRPAGATNAAWVITNVLPASAGGYAVIVTNGYGAVTSSVAALTVLPQPSMVTVGGNQILSATGGIPGGACYLVDSTNLDLPLNQWTRVATNQFDGAGNLAITNPPNVTSPRVFYRLILP